jgi:cysteine desulfurase/selenocysteine lyase
MENKFRSYFPVTEKYIYLNHAGVSPISSPVKKAVEQFLEHSNRSGIVGIEKLFARGEEVRDSIASFVGAEKKEIAYVRSTSHGLSLVAEGIDWKEGENVVTASCEFPSNVYPWMNLTRHGVETRLVDAVDGEVRVEDLLAKMDDKTRLLSLSWVEYGNGFRNDLEAIGTICRERGIYFCVDGIQGVGAIPLDLTATCVDFLAADAHKWLLGPEGIGFLYVSKRVIDRVHPVIVGWHSVVHPLDFEDVDFTLRDDAAKFEEGSPSFMGIMALGAAVALLAEVGVDAIWSHIKILNDHAAGGLKEKGYELLTSMEEKKRSGILTFCSHRHSNEKLFRILSEAGIVVAVRGGGIRISPHFYNTIEEIDRFLDLLP